MFALLHGKEVIRMSTDYEVRARRVACNIERLIEVMLKLEAQYEQDRINNRARSQAIARMIIRRQERLRALMLELYELEKLETDAYLQTLQSSHRSKKSILKKLLPGHHATSWLRSLP